MSSQVINIRSDINEVRTSLSIDPVGAEKGEQESKVESCKADFEVPTAFDFTVSLSDHKTTDASKCEDPGDPETFKETVFTADNDRKDADPLYTTLDATFNDSQKMLLEKSASESLDFDNDGSKNDLYGEMEDCSEKKVKIVVPSKEIEHPISPAVKVPEIEISEESIQKQQTQTNIGLLALPLDSLHHIASFLTPHEWTLSWGLTCRAAHTASQQVLARVLLHGFKCALEVITALESHNHADAMELAALYLAAGVPIYPHCHGHAFRTLVWRIKVQVKALQQQGTLHQGLKTSQTTIDPFFNDRWTFRAAQGYNGDLSFLEEKALFYWHLRNQRSSRTNESSLSQRRFWNPHSITSETSEDTEHSREIMSTVPIHAHLLNQHLLGKFCVRHGPEDGVLEDRAPSMLASPRLSLSADFFHTRLNMDITALLPCRIIQNQINSPDTANVESTTGSTTAPGGDTNDDDSDDDIRLLEEVHPGEPVADDANPDNAAAQHQHLLPPPLSRLKTILQATEFKPYTAAHHQPTGEKETADQHSSKKAQFAVHEKRFRSFLGKNDWAAALDECLLDLWDEFLSQTALIQYWDSHTAVPRASKLTQFLTQPCPKAVGIIQCEIERIKSSSSGGKGGVKGRFFPTYEYRLFIRHYPPSPFDDQQHQQEHHDASITVNNSRSDSFVRKDLLLLVAKHQGRNKTTSITKQVPGGHNFGGELISGSSSVGASSKGTSKRSAGANNYGIYFPQQPDVDAHFQKVNNISSSSFRIGRPQPQQQTTPITVPGHPPKLMGRLQGNFIGTEFQLFVPRVVSNLDDISGRWRTAMKQPCPTASAPGTLATSDDDEGYDSGGFASDTNTANTPLTTRRSRFSRFLRTGSTTPSNLEQGTNRELSSRLRSQSAPASRSPSERRPNRRAIANENQAPFAISSYSNSTREEEDGVITYTANLLGSRPRIMDVCIPKVSLSPETGHVVVGAEWKRYLKDCAESADDVAQVSSMLHCFKLLQQRLETLDPQLPRQQGELQEMQDAAQHGQDARHGQQDGDNNTHDNDFGLLALQNRPPWWNVELGSFVLNFGGRVSVASVKNFQLVDRRNQDDIMLQFGRIQGRHAFTMDYQYPLTTIQAFAIAISSLQSKMSFG